jgi:hypothetical protein
MQWPEPRCFQVDVGARLVDGTGSRYLRRLRNIEGPSTGRPTRPVSGGAQ